MNMIKNVLEFEKYYLEMLGEHITFKEYFVIGKYKGKDIVIYKANLVKGLWLPIILKE